MAACIAPAALFADATPADDVKAAVKKLTDASGYSWKTTVTMPENSRFRPGPTEGKTEKDGYTCVSMTMREDSKLEGIMKGDKVAVKGQDGAWKTPEEMAAARSAEGGNGGGGGGERRGPGRGFGGGRMFQNYKTPAAQADELAGKAKDLKKADDAVSGDLPEDAVKQLLSFGGRGRDGGNSGNGPDIKDAKGSVKFWLKDGALAKMELKVSGSMSFNGNDRSLERTTTTEISGVGSTKVEVPEEAKKKLEGAAK